MKFKIHIYKIGSLFHLVSNFTEWHFSCSEYSNKAWLKKTGPLSKEEKKALKDFRKLVLKYNFERKFLGKPLMGFSEKIAWEKLEKLFKKNEFEKIKKIFKVFEPRFEKIWGNEYPRLLKWKQFLEKSNQNLVRNICKDLEIFYKSKLKNKNLYVYLLISGDPESLGGQANIGKDKITLEIGGTDFKRKNDVLQTLFHEMAHRKYENNYCRKLIKKYLKNHKLEKEIKKLGFAGKSETLLNEAITSSLIPEGYFTEKYFKKKIGKIDKKFIAWIKKNPQIRFKIRVYISRKMLNTTKDYIENKKTIDENYLKKIHKAYRDYLKIVNQICNDSRNPKSQSQD